MLRWYNIWCRVRYPQFAYSTINSSAFKPEVDKVEQDQIIKRDAPQLDKSVTQESKIVAAAFASLRDLSSKSKSKTAVSIDEKLSKAVDVNNVLSVADQPVLGKYHALKVVSTLSEWFQQGKIHLDDFVTDRRFVKICRILGHTAEMGPSGNAADLSIVLGITADEEAAKLINSVDLPLMIKVLSSLSEKKRRSTSLLRSLSSNICNSPDKMDIKQASDVLYACASLSYPDEVLLEKATSDFIENLENNKKSSVVNSVIKSVGILRYRNTRLLDRISDWLIENKDVCHKREFLSTLFTLASVNYLPENSEKFMEILKTFLVQEEVIEWIDSVWALIALDQFEEECLKSVLNASFISKLDFKDNMSGIATKLKLLNINAYAKQRVNQYNGPLLDEKSPIWDIHIMRTKDKQVIFDSVLETLVSSVTSFEHLRTDVNSKMGFLIDVECFIDSQKNFVKLSQRTEKNVSKVAIMVSYYHDMCRGCHNEPTGITALSHKLLKNNGYKVLCVPYTEFNPREKLMARLRYLSEKLKMLD